MLHQFPTAKGTEPPSTYAFLCFLGAVDRAKCSIKGS